MTRSSDGASLKAIPLTKHGGHAKKKTTSPISGKNTYIYGKHAHIYRNFITIKLNFMNIRTHIGMVHSWVCHMNFWVLIDPSSPSPRHGRSREKLLTAHGLQNPKRKKHRWWDFQHEYNDGIYIYTYISCVGTSMVIYYTYIYTDVLDVNAINKIGYDVFMVQHTSF